MLKKCQCLLTKFDSLLLLTGHIFEASFNTSFLINQNLEILKHALTIYTILLDMF